MSEKSLNTDSEILDTILKHEIGASPSASGSPQQASESKVLRRIARTGDWIGRTLAIGAEALCPHSNIPRSSESRK
jgi:hypothetical protein